MNINSSLVEDIISLDEVKEDMTTVLDSLKDDFTRNLSIRTSPGSELIVLFFLSFLDCAFHSSCFSTKFKAENKGLPTRQMKHESITSKVKRNVQISLHVRTVQTENIKTVKHVAAKLYLCARPAFVHAQKSSPVPHITRISQRGIFHKGLWILCEM